MYQDGWEETIANKTANDVAEAGVGCLLQIHPLEVSGNLTELSQAKTTVGRDAGCGLHLPDSSVSRNHALIECDGDTYRVTDLGSTNGTSVNEQRVSSEELSSGDRVQFGNYIFKFLSSNHVEMQYHEAVYSMMTRDGLTGVLNKRSFLDIIDREFRRSVSRSTSLSLILLDIDHFKSINDTHGHLAGDEVLQELCARIGSVVPEHDVFARYGGEEFAILMADVAASEAAELAELTRMIVEQTPFETSVGPLPVTVSLGIADVAALPSPQASSQLVQASDKKLYEAKNGGRNRVCL